MKLTESLLRKIILEEIEKEVKDFLPKRKLIDLGRGGGSETWESEELPDDKKHWFPIFANQDRGMGDSTIGYREPSEWFSKNGRVAARTLANAASNSRTAYQQFKSNPSKFSTKVFSRYKDYPALLMPENADILQKVIEMAKSLLNK